MVQTFNTFSYFFQLVRKIAWNNTPRILSNTPQTGSSFQSEQDAHGVPRIQTQQWPASSRHPAASVHQFLYHFSQQLYWERAFGIAVTS